MAEIGHALNNSSLLIGEDNWDLKWPNSVRQFSKMLREDAQVRSVHKAVTLPILRTTWRVDPSGADDEVTRLVAEDLRLPVLGDDGSAPLAVTGGHFSFQDHLYWALQSLTYGVMFFEKVYRVVDGRDRLWKLAPRMPDTISKINISDDGGLESIEQVGVTRQGRPLKPVKIPVERLLVYVHDPVMMDWQGTSLFRPAYKHWVLKDQLLRLEAQVLERNGMGVPVYTASDPAFGDTDGEVEQGTALAQGLRAGSMAGAGIPHSAKLTIEGVSGQLVSPREAINYHDSQIGRSALAHFLNLEGKGGSYSLAEVQANIFIQSLQTVAENISDTVNRYLIEPLVDQAFDTVGGPYPRLVCDPIGTKTDLTAEALAVLVNAGIILPDKDLEEEMRRRSSLPPKRPLPKKPVEEPTAEKLDPQEIQTLAQAVALLINSGFDPDEALKTVGLDPIEHAGLIEPARSVEGVDDAGNIDVAAS